MKPLSTHDLDNLYLEEATSRNELTRQFLQLLPPIAVKHLEASENHLRNELKHEALDTCLQSYWLIKSEALRQEVHKQQWAKTLTQEQTDLWMSERQVVQDKLSTAFDCIKILTLEDLEEEVRNSLHHEQSRTRGKRFGPAHLSNGQLVLGYQIKCHQGNAIFSDNWKKTGTLNGGQVSQDLDPYRHTEAFLTDFLKTQAMLKGPLVRHFPRILDTKRWADIVFQQEQMAKQTQAIAFDSLPECDLVPISFPTGQHPAIQMLTYTSDLAQQLFRTEIPSQEASDFALILDSDHICQFKDNLLHLSTLTVQFFKQNRELTMSLA